MARSALSRGRQLALLVAACTFAVNPTAATFAQNGAVAEYTAGGTVVVRADGRSPVVDTGVVVCQPKSQSGYGGTCLPFGGGDSVGVFDSASGTQVAFQVCIDNDGDGRCVSPGFSECSDDIFFSHDDRGNFFNPLGKLPSSFRPGCPGGGWKGYVVFLCEGVHGAGGAHAHAARNGITRVMFGGTGFGDFCGGTTQSPSDKRYVVS